MTKREDITARLKMYADAHDGQFYREEAEAALPCSTPQFYLGIMDLRLLLRNENRCLATIPTGASGGRLYQVTDVWVEAYPYVLTSTKEAKTRLERMAADAEVLALPLSGRTARGKQAKAFARRMVFIRDELRDLVEDPFLVDQPIES